MAKTKGSGLLLAHVELSLDALHSPAEARISLDLIVHAPNHAAHTAVIGYPESFPYGRQRLSGESPREIDSRISGFVRRTPLTR